MFSGEINKEILKQEQIDLLTYLKKFTRSYYLVGGTAIALQIGHRYSNYFDLFTSTKINKSNIRAWLLTLPFNYKILFEDVDQLHYEINNVRVTFLQFPFPVPLSFELDKIIKFPSLLNLAAMKAYAMGRRAKWKDYVDLYFIIKDYYSIKEISKEADSIFGNLFSEKLFRQQLAFHDDIDYSEDVEYLIRAVPEQRIKEFLLKIAVEF